ncbi:MAG: AzlD domain-containing protein [Sedimenticola sp.]
MSEGIDTLTLWLTIAGLGMATFLIRFSFLGLVKGGRLPHYIIRLLRYVPVTVLPALIAPMIVYPKSMGGETDLLWVTVALFALLVGIWTKNMLATIVSGMGLLWLLQGFGF